jgi:hypothetical protein
MTPRAFLPRLKAMGFLPFPSVKSTAVSKLKDHPRVASVDSMAWNYAARREAFTNRVPKTKELLCDKMTAWIVRQRKMSRPSAQLALF